MRISFFLVFLSLFFSLFADEGLLTFRAECLQCHKTNGLKIRPSDKAAVQWQRFFDKNRHLPSLILSNKSKETIKKFLIDHSADSDYPTVPGLY